MDNNTLPNSGNDSISQGLLRSDNGHDTNERRQHKSFKASNSRPSTSTLSFDELFGPKNFTRFYSILPTGESNLTKLNMFKVDKEIRNNIGICKKITEEYTNKSWTVEVRSREQGEKLMKMTKLLQEPITVKPHGQHNTSQGVITCTLLKGYSDAEIAEGLSEQGVTYCRRIIRNSKSEHPEPTATLILTFNTTEPPNRITIRTGLVEKVRLYIPLPRRCFKCHKYGHSGAKCRSTVSVCGRCGENENDDHKSKTCQQPIKCCHCNTAHLVSSKNCPRYLYEKEVLTIKTKEHLTFKEARDKVNATLPFPARTYANVTAEATRDTNQITAEKTNSSVDSNNNISEPLITQAIKRPLVAVAEPQDDESAKRKKENENKVNEKPNYILPYQITFDLNSDEDDMEIPNTPDDKQQPIRKDQTYSNIKQQEEKIWNIVRRKERGKGKSTPSASINR